MGRSIPFKDIRLNGKRLNENNARSLNEFISRPWWNRVWAQQEYILAKDVTLHCGLLSVEYSPVLKLGNTDLLCLCKDWEISLWHFSQIVIGSGATYMLFKKYAGHSIRFAVVLADGCFKDCTDLRDSIYGFLGLARQDLVDAIRPDYSIPLKDVLLRTAVKYISCTGSLSFFSFTNWKPKTERLVPTWVPDWPRLGPFDVSGNEHTTPNLEQSQWRIRGQRLAMNLEFEACATRTLSFEIINETTVMLNGHCPGQVTHISRSATQLSLSRLHSEQNVLQVIETSLKFFNRFADHAAFPSAAEAGEDPMWRILIGDQYFDDPGIWRTCETTDYGAYQEFRRHLVGTSRMTIVAKEYWTSFVMANTGRRLFATNRGYIGLGPSEMQEGDHVYIISGGNIPYILRPVSGKRPQTFELVGGCYLHGVMYGEAAGTDEDYHDVYLE